MTLLKRRLRLFFAATIGLGLAVLLAACDDASSTGANGSNGSNGVTISPVETSPTPTVIPTPSQPQTPSSPIQLKGFIFPIANGCLPTGDQLMPNAPRPYRNGVHEGVDFYEVDNCVPIARGTPVLAARQGRVIRADHDYVSPTQAQMDALLANPNSADALDAFRGRQVWIEHETPIGLVVTRYAHLGGIATGLTVGQTVSAGQVIAYVGNTGTPESLVDPTSEMHLHFELRIGESFMGAGLTPGEVRQLYRTLFTP